MVFLHNNILDKQWFEKVDNHQLRSYLIREAQLDLGTYLFRELDEAQFNELYVGDRLKSFFKREEIDLDAGEDAADNGLEEEVKEETEKEKND